MIGLFGIIICRRLSLTFGLWLRCGFLYFVIVFTLIASTITWWTSIYVNRHVRSDHRATALSTWAMLQKVPYILLVGTITNLSGQDFSIFILASGFIVGIFAVGTLVLLPKIDPTSTAS